MEIQIPDWGGSPLYTLKTLSSDMILLSVHGYEGNTVWKYANSMADLLEKNFTAGSAYYLIIDLTITEKNMMIPFDNEINLIKDDVLRRIKAYTRIATLAIINKTGLIFNKHKTLSQQIVEQIPYIAVKSYNEALAWIEADRAKDR